LIAPGVSVKFWTSHSTVKVLRSFYEIFWTQATVGFQ
jgi:hypothetical protein